MEIEFLWILRQSLFLEVLTLVISLRIAWSQTLPDELSDFRGTPLLTFFPRRTNLRKNIIASQIEMLKGSRSQDFQQVLREQEALRSLVLAFNSISGFTTWTWIGILAACAGAVLYLNPLVLCSMVVADLLIARIHQNIISSL
jgi:hypothetical protein